MIFSILLLTACDRAPCEVTAAIQPGCGLELEGTDVHVGDEYKRLERKLGDPLSHADFGPLGTLATWSGGVSAFLDEELVVTSLRIGEGFAGQTADGLGLGSTQEAVTGAFGVANVDPILGTWWYADPGIGFEWDDQGATRIVIGTP